MKKIIALVLLFALALSFSGCFSSGTGSPSGGSSGNGGSNGSKAISLTLDNYSQYLEISAKCYGTDSAKVYDEKGGYYSYQNIAYSAEVSPASVNLFFSNAEVVVKIYCEYQYLRSNSYAEKHDETLTVKLNIGGSGSKLLNKPTATDEDVLLHAFGAYQVNGLYFEVVSVSGTVEIN